MPDWDGYAVLFRQQRCRLQAVYSSFGVSPSATIPYVPRLLPLPSRHCLTLPLTLTMLFDRPVPHPSTHRWSSPGRSPKSSATPSTRAPSSVRSPTRSSISATRPSSSFTPLAQVRKHLLTSRRSQRVGLSLDLGAGFAGRQSGCPRIM